MPYRPQVDIDPAIYDEVRAAVAMKAEAKQRFRDALQAALDAGGTYRSVAKVAGVSHTMVANTVNAPCAVIPDPVKQKARQVAHLARVRGELVPEPCEQCGSTYAIQMHHDDYAKPLDVRWFCRPHHVQLHTRLRKLAASDVTKD